ncbi:MULTISPECIES: hypothetical protein [unclassified Dysgonomonas]|nr:MULTISPECIES: hypothetical protein [unclassified Dysgonomonas]
MPQNKPKKDKPKAKKPAKKAVPKSFDEKIEKALKFNPNASKKKK